MQNSHSQNQTLADLKTGERAIFINIQAGRSFASRLSSLGFTPGVEIEMYRNYGHGPLAVNIRGSRVALGRQEARKILIRKETRP